MFNLTDFTNYKQAHKKISMVTAYDYYSAKILEAANIDTILVGDSLGMVFAGHDNTLAVNLDDMIYHAKAVRKGAPKSFICVDMPYLSYHLTPLKTVQNAGRIIKETNANAIKVEINSPATLKHIKALIDSQIPVIGHIGLTPQSVNMFGGFKLQGKNKEQKDKIINFAHQLTKLGVSAIVLECMPKELAATITQQISIATIGIGSGNGCDGQVLVFHDLLGFEPNNKLSFVKQYANTHDYLVGALRNYANDITQLKFPA